MLSPSQTSLLFTFTEVLCQTIAYGVFIAIITVSTHVLSKQGMKARPNVVMLGMTLFMFALSTAYWAVTVVSFVSQITVFHVHRNSVIREMFNAVVLVNYLFADGVVVWRMRVLCDSQVSRKFTMIPFFMLALTFLSVGSTIGLRIAVTASPDSTVPRNGVLAEGIDFSQIINLVLSLFTNVTATTIIGVWAWQYRRTIAVNLNANKASTQVERIMILLAESGIVYCVSSILVLVCSFVSVPGGTLGDIYTSIHVQIAGMYPALVMILVDTQRSSKALISSSFMDNNSNSSTKKTAQMEPLRFTHGSSMQSRSAVSGQTNASVLRLSIGPEDSFWTVGNEDITRDGGGKDPEDFAYSSREKSGIV